MMKKRITIISLMLLSLAANFAVASDRDKDWRDDDRCRGEARRCVSAPEIDPAQAMGAMTLLAGAVAIVRGHRRRKK